MVVRIDAFDRTMLDIVVVTLTDFGKNYHVKPNENAVIITDTEEEDVWTFLHDSNINVNALAIFELEQ